MFLTLFKILYPLTGKSSNYHKSTETREKKTAFFFVNKLQKKRIDFFLQKKCKLRLKKILPSKLIIDFKNCN